MTQNRFSAGQRGVNRAGLSESIDGFAI